MADKLDFMNELARDVDARKHGKTSSFGSISDYETKMKRTISEADEDDDLYESSYEDFEETEPEEEEIKETPVKRKKKVEQEEDDELESFAKEERVRIEKPERKLKKGVVLLLILFLLAVVGLIIYLVFVPKIRMENFVGSDLTRVSNWAVQNKMESTAIAKEEEYSLEYGKGIVVSQSVAEGTKIKPSTPVTLVISKGPDPDEQIDFPDLYFMTQQEIESWKNENQLLKYKLTTQYSSSVEAGKVISYEVKNGDEASFTRGTTLNIICSKGEAPAGKVTVENLVGKTYSEAETWARNKKIMLEKTETYSDSAASGIVISQSVKGGEAMDNTAVLMVIVSKGKGVTVPNLVGYTEEQLNAWKANTANNVVIVTKSQYSTSPAGSVLAQSIPANTLVDGGSVLELTISLYLPILQTNSQEWIGKDYLQLKAWCDEVNSKGADIQAGEYLWERVHSSATKGSILKIACEFGTEASSGDVVNDADYANNGCERPLSLNARISYQVSLGPEETPQSPQSQVVLITSTDLSTLNGMYTFCNTNASKVACTFKSDDSFASGDLEVKTGSGTVLKTQTGAPEVTNLMLDSGTGITIKYSSK